MHMLKYVCHPHAEDERSQNMKSPLGDHEKLLVHNPREQTHLIIQLPRDIVKDS